MIYRVVVTPPAELDLRRNADWWARHHSTEQAARWFEAAYKDIGSLKQLPERCPLSAENDDFDYEIRDLLFGLGPRPSYRAVFTIVDELVYVIAVHRGMQDTISPDQIDFTPETT